MIKRQMIFDNRENSRGRGSSSKCTNAVEKGFAKPFSKSGSRIDMFFNTLANTLAVLCAVLIMWFLISWVDFCAHDLSRNFDFWLGNLNLIEIICGG